MALIATLVQTVWSPRSKVSDGAALSRPVGLRLGEGTGSPGLELARGLPRASPGPCSQVKEPPAGVEEPREEQARGSEKLDTECEAAFRGRGALAAPRALTLPSPRTPATAMTTEGNGPREETDTMGQWANRSGLCRRRGFSQLAAGAATVGWLLLTVGPADGTELRSEWLARDAEVVARVAAALPLSLGAAQPLIDRLAPAHPARTFRQDLGFGGEWIFFRMSGGYAACDVAIVAFRGHLARVDIRCADAGSTSAPLRRPAPQRPGGWQQ